VGPPFKLVSELYYKSLTDVNTYTDNVRIRYSASNVKGYAQGLDFRLNGEFVPGTESWFSFGYLKTEENSEDKGYIARPTDQRLKFGLLFQDYMPNIPSVKIYLNLVYNTGLPGGSPSCRSLFVPKPIK
jgi:predicted transcriptional regulator with HTH domain